MRTVQIAWNKDHKYDIYFFEGITIRGCREGVNTEELLGRLTRAWLVYGDILP